jgi:integrase
MARDDKPFSMRGKVRKKRENHCIDLHWKGERYFLYSDKDGVAFGPSIRHAERMLAHINYEIDHGIFDPKNYIKRELKSLLFANYAQAWLDRQQSRAEKGRLSREYIRSVSSYLRNHLIPALASKSIRDINAGGIEDLVDGFEDISAKTIRNIIFTLHKILKDAKRRGDINKLPEFPKIEVGEPDTRWLLPEDTMRIIGAIPCPVRRAFFIFLAEMGCRPGEARALRWEKVDFRKGMVKIAAGMDGEIFRPTTKEKDARELPMSESVMEALESLPRSLNGFVFTYRGRPFTHKLIDRTWRKACKEVGIEGITLYQGTKHSKGTWAATQGIPMNLIQDYFGHKSQASTRRYAKIAKKEIFKVLHYPSANRVQKEKVSGK